ncbi:endonuclease/exonuclease/phosphatase family protein [uncultured Devosia sp.]|uniref:endonuclease/exonuclease/phosphatase family protein n=1 Tax=uncultured Devosia sp. TaxID=211434 RepID=UPI00262D125C|nr:endonuclease/exonuclease/phosphatase family protein [uncultured Devosia sp.]
MMIFKTRKRFWLFALGGVVAYLAGVVLINANLVPASEQQSPPPMASLPSQVSLTFTVATWNLGYAGLGAGSNFIADGGSALLPPSRRAVDENLQGILATLPDIDSDIMLFQEVSNASPLSYWAPVRQELLNAFADRQSFYRPDAASRFIPFPLAIDHGTVSVSRINPAGIEIVPLPSEPGAMLGFLKRRYALHVMRFPVADRASQLVIANLHLSAFDDGGHTRQAQIDAVLAFAQAEFAEGNYVVLGGDWNMVLSDPGIAHQTDDKYLFWIHPFPEEKLPEGWALVTDRSTPTVRTLHQPYVAGDNYVTSIDGFIISPNLTTQAVHTKDLQFQFSDHQPVKATFTMR